VATAKEVAEEEVTVIEVVVVVEEVSKMIEVVVVVEEVSKMNEVVEEVLKVIEVVEEVSKVIEVVEVEVEVVVAISLVVLPWTHVRSSTVALSTTIQLSGSTICKTKIFTRTSFKPLMAPSTLSLRSNRDRQSQAMELKIQRILSIIQNWLK